MSGPRETSAAPRERIDPVSRRTLTRAAFRLGGIMLLIMWPYVSGSRPLATALDLLSTFGAAAGIFCAFVALSLGEKVGQGGLNHWDEALIYVALTRLVHFAQTYQG